MITNFLNTKTKYTYCQNSTTLFDQQTLIAYDT